MNEASEERAVSGHLIRIDRMLCIGTGNCVAVGPDGEQLVPPG